MTIPQSHRYSPQKGDKSMASDVIIDQPRESDFQSLRTLFINALEPYYDGDHDAHLTRLFKAHRVNGKDHNGFNSLAQLGYVARLDPTGPAIGYINFAIKRHGTAKVSPLIVSPSLRCQGVGKALLNTAPKDARLLYCTVSEDNVAARNFFLRQGFVQIGTAPDQYRRGKTELIMQQPRIYQHTETKNPVNLIRIKDSEEWQNFIETCNSIQVNQAPPVSTKIIYGSLESEPDPVNTKAKTGYFAISPDSENLGGILLSKKKGGSTKVSTLAWGDTGILEQIVTALYQTEEFLDTRGRFYVHMPVTPDVTSIFQAHQWRLDALIPGLDGDHVLAQWSISPVHSNQSLPLPTSVNAPRNWSEYHTELRNLIADREWSSFETPQELLISLIAEVGELAEELQWKSNTPTNQLDKRSIGAELVDVYNYLLRLSWHIDIDLLNVAFQKLAQVKEKYPVDKARGTTRKYTELRRH